MSSEEARQTVLRQFVTDFGQDKLPALGDYFPEYVKAGCEAAAEEFRLVPLTATSWRARNLSPYCVTDCMLELQSKYAQFVPDDWGGRMEKGYRDLGVIGFNVLEGSVLDIQELHRTVTFLAWAEPKLHALHWERLLLRAVVDFGRYCGARQIRIQPATFLSADSSTQADAARQAEQREACRQLAEASVPAARFDYDPGLDRLVLNLESN